MRNLLMKFKLNKSRMFLLLLLSVFWGESFGQVIERSVVPSKKVVESFDNTIGKEILDVVIKNSERLENKLKENV